MIVAEAKRFSDPELHALKGEVNRVAQTLADHVVLEDSEHRQQQEIYEALFRQEDKGRGIPAGVIQMLDRIDMRVTAMEIMADRQKRFIGGFIFAFGCMAFFLTDSFHRLVAALKAIAS